MVNLLFIDSKIPGLNQFTDSCNENTSYIVYDSFQDTFDTIKEKVNNLNLTKIDNLGFVFVDEHNPLKFFVSFNTFISFDESGIKENNVTKFIKELVEKYEIKIIDFLACNLLSYPEWKNYFDYLMKENTGLKVRASNDRTGNLQAGGDWILESTNEDVRDLYFTDKIGEWNYLLDFSIGSLILSDDKLYSCGNLNLNINENFIFNNVSNGINGKKVISISCGDLHTAIIIDEPTNNLYTCGYNYYGQLGLGNTDNKFTFTQVPLNGKKIISIGCGSIHTAIITDEPTNNLYTCGYNGNGQLGLGDTNQRTTFQQVITNLENKKVTQLWGSSLLNTISYGDPYITTLNGKTYKLSDRKAIYRLFEGKNIIINAEIDYISEEQQEKLRNIENKLKEKHPNLSKLKMITNGVLYSKFYINNDGEEIIIDLKDKKLIKLTEINNITIQKEYLSENNIMGIKNSKCIKVPILINNKNYGIITVELQFYENPQIENGINITVQRYDNFVGLLADTYKEDDMIIDSITDVSTKLNKKYEIEQKNGITAENEIWTAF